MSEIMGLEASKTEIKEDKKGFELTIEGTTAYIDYILNSKGVMYLTHTEVPDILEGQGVGRKIVRETLASLSRNCINLLRYVLL